MSRNRVQDPVQEWTRDTKIMEKVYLNMCPV